MVSAKDLASALKDAKARKLPLVISMGVPAAKIPADVRKMSRDGKIIFLAIDNDNADARAVQRRYGQKSEGAILADELGNLLKADLAATDIAEAVNNLDELTAALFERWSGAIKQARPLIEKQQFPQAAQVLRVFAFASGGDKAAEGKRLYDEVAGHAEAEYKELSRTMPQSENDATRRQWIEKLSQFAAKWPATPAAFAAEDRALELGK